MRSAEYVGVCSLMTSVARATNAHQMALMSDSSSLAQTSANNMSQQPTYGLRQIYKMETINPPIYDSQKYGIVCLYLTMTLMVPEPSDSLR